VRKTKTLQTIAPSFLQATSGSERASSYSPSFWDLRTKVKFEVVAHGRLNAPSADASEGVDASDAGHIDHIDVGGDAGMDRGQVDGGIPASLVGGIPQPPDAVGFGHGVLSDATGISAVPTKPNTSRTAEPLPSHCARVLDA
jgi:hypothetical protein